MSAQTRLVPAVALASGETRLHVYVIDHANADLDRLAPEVTRGEPLFSGRFDEETASAISTALGSVGRVEFVASADEVLMPGPPPGPPDCRIVKNGGMLFSFGILYSGSAGRDRLLMAHSNMRDCLFASGSLLELMAGDPWQIREFGVPQP